MISKTKQYIEILRQQLQSSDAYEEIMDYFSLNLGAESAFINESLVLKKHTTLENIIKNIMLNYTDTKEPLSPMLAQIQGTDFIHGNCIVQDTMFTIIFFEKTQLGLISVSSLTSNLIEYIRFKDSTFTVSKTAACA